MEETLQQYLDQNLGGYPTNVKYRVHAEPIAEKKDRHAILQRLAREHKAITSGEVNPPKKRMYMGAAGLANFDFIWEGKFDAAVLFDVNEHQKTFWEGLFKIILESKTLKEFRQNFDKESRNPELFPQTDHYFDAITKKNVDNFLGDTTWAKSQEKYQFIRKMISEGKIGFALVDILDLERCKAVHDAIAEYDNGSFHVDTIYASNIWDMIGPRIKYDFLQKFLDYIAVKIGEEDLQPSKAESLYSKVEELVKSFDSENENYQKADIIQAITESVIEALKTKPSDYKYQGSLYRNGAAEFSDQFYKALSKRFVFEDYEQLGAVHFRDQDFHARFQGKITDRHLEGIISLSTDDNTKIYLAKTADNYIGGTDGNNEPSTVISGGHISSSRWRDASPLSELTP